MAPQSKRRKLNESKTEEVVFDPSARFEYLTGFHKRKVERAKHAQEAALRRAREEKIQERKKLREERKVELQRHLQQVNAMLPAKLAAEADDDDSDDDDGQEDHWNGLADPETVPVDHEDEYIDEDKYTTVTVEEVDISRNGLTKLRESDEEEEEVAISAVVIDKEPVKSSAKPKVRKTGPTSVREKSGKTKKRKKRDFRYENKADRKLNHLKVQAKKSKLAKARRDG